VRRLAPFAVKMVDRVAGEFACGDTVTTNRLLVSQLWRLPGWTVTVVVPVLV